MPREGETSFLFRVNEKSGVGDGDNWVVAKCDPTAFDTRFARRGEGGMMSAGGVKGDDLSSTSKKEL